MKSGPESGSSTPASSRRRAERSARIGLLLASSLIALLIGEVAVRMFDIGPTIHVVFQELVVSSENPELEYELLPGATDGTVQINDAGYRGPLYPEAKPPDVFRLVLIGDSVTYGLMCREGTTYARRLEGLLGAYASPDAPRFEVINLGVTGYNITQSVETLRVKGLRLDPDLIIYGYVLNDPEAFSLEGDALRELQALERERFRRPIHRGLQRALSHSRLYLLTRHVLMGRERPRYTREADGRYYEAGSTVGFDPPPVPGREGVVRGTDWTKQDDYRMLHTLPIPKERFQAGMAKLGSVTRKAGVPAVVAVFPVFFADLEQPYPLADVHEMILAEALRQDASPLDLAPAYRAVFSAFGRCCVADPLHPNEFGHQVAAVALLRGLLQMGLLPAGSVVEADLMADQGIDGSIARALAAESEGNR